MTGAGAQRARVTAAGAQRARARSVAGALASDVGHGGRVHAGAREMRGAPRKKCCGGSGAGAMVFFCASAVGKTVSSGLLGPGVFCS